MTLAPMIEAGENSESISDTLAASVSYFALESVIFNWNDSWIVGKNSILMDPMRQLRWPVRGRPRVLLAGLFPLEARGFDHSYRSGVHAIHLHEYAGTIRLGEEAHRLEPGTLTVSPAEEESSYDLPRPGVHWCIHFEALRVRRGEPAVGLPLVLRLGAAQGEAVKRFSHITRMRGLMGGDGEVARGGVGGAAGVAAVGGDVPVDGYGASGLGWRACF